MDDTKPIDAPKIDVIGCRSVPGDDTNDNIKMKIMNQMQMIQMLLKQMKLYIIKLLKFPSESRKVLW